MEAQELGSALRAARRRVGLSQTDVGDLVGTDRFHVADLEQGRYTTQVQRLLAIIDVLGLEVDLRPRSAGLAAPRDAP